MSPFQRFLKSNTKLWDGWRPKSPSKSYVLVELIADHPGYLMGNLILANHLAKIHGCGIIAMGEPGKMLNALAESYGVEVMLPLLLPSSIVPEKQMELVSSKLDTPDSLLKTRVAGIPVGDIIYDSYLRQSGYGTVRSVEDAKQYVLHCLAFVNYFNNIFGRYNIACTVQGHVVYTTFGAMARVALKKGIRVYSKKPASSMTTLRAYDRMEDAFYSEMDYDLEWFTRLYAQYGEALAEEGSRILDQRFKGRMPQGDGSPYQSECAMVYGGGQQPATSDLVRDLGMNPDNKTALIMAHLFSDSPHIWDNMLYRDYYQAMVETLRIAADIPGVNWLVKEHPVLKQYNPRETSADALREAFPDGNVPSHIHLLPDGINPSALFPLADAIVTVQGTATLEYAYLGVPSILSANGCNSRAGVGRVARDKDHYRELLQSIPAMPRVDDAERKLAAGIFALQREYNLVPTAHLPDIGPNFYDTYDADAFWEEAARRAETIPPADDPLYNALVRMLERGENYIVNYDRLDELNQAYLHRAVV